MEYKKMIFEIPIGWDINHCFVKIENNKVIIDHPVDHMIFERCISELLETDEVIEKIKEDDVYSNKTNKLPTKEIIKRLRNRLHISREELGLKDYNENDI